MTQSGHFSIVVVDIAGSGALNGPAKQAVRADLYRLLESALLESEISPESVVSEDRGDGVYLLVGSDVPVGQLLHPFISVLDAGLAAREVGDPRLRLRLVIHDGQVARDANGSSGVDVDLAFALVDAQQLRDALTDAPDGRLAVVVGDTLYRSVVCGHAELDETAFRMRLLRTKRGEIRAWITVTGAARQPEGRSRAGHDEPEHRVEPVAPVFRPHLGDKVRGDKVRGDKIGIDAGRNRGMIVGKVGRDATSGTDSDRAS
jgi:hypothetical protein